MATSLYASINWLAIDHLQPRLYRASDYRQQSIIIIIIIKDIYIAQVRKGHNCVMSAEMTVWLRYCLCLCRRADKPYASVSAYS